MKVGGGGVVGVHENLDLPDAFHEQRIRASLAGESGGPQSPEKK